MALYMQRSFVNRSTASINNIVTCINVTANVAKGCSYIYKAFAADHLFVNGIHMKPSITILALYCCMSSFAQTNQSPKIPVLIRCDDIGMCHAVNEAAKKILETGMPVSMSVMVPCPWFSEAAELLKGYSNVSIGIHLVLNSEWRLYRWGPVTGARTVPSLVDSAGLFFPTRDALFAHGPKLSEIETELEAQIEKALKAGLKIDYLDYHMGTAVSTPETRAIVEKLASEYKLAISRYYMEDEILGWYAAPPVHKLDSMMTNLKKAQPGNTKLMVCHIGLETSEMNALEDFNPNGPKEMSKHRNGELNALLSPQFQKLIHDPKYTLVNYGMLKKEKGLEAMQRPK
jgi:chitin disaccharide deacetylase